MELTDRKWHLMAKALNHEASSEELEELYGLLHQSDSLKQQFELLNRIWKENDDSDDEGGDARNTIQRIMNRASEEQVEEAAPSHLRRRRRHLLIGALSLLFVASIVFTWKFVVGKSYVLASDRSGVEVLEAKKGSRSRSLLPDGTTVWLNAGSRLHYENDFAGATREVRLEGEAFFDVVKNAHKPFIVHTSGIEIKVLGTAFNVKAYPEDKTVETTLYRGSVKVYREAETEKNAVNLVPNQKLIYPKEAAIESDKLSQETGKSTEKIIPTFTIASIDSTKEVKERLETAWLYSRLEFRGDSFEELARKLERWYNVSIHFEDEKVKQLNFNGSFETETVDQAFRYLYETIPLFTYKINNHEISVGSPK